jgi:hypothetical protein
MMMYHGYGRNRRRTEIQKCALKMHRNTEVHIEDGLESHNISRQSRSNEVGDDAAMNGLECCITSWQPCRNEVGNDIAIRWQCCRNEDGLESCNEVTMMLQ